MTHEEMDHIAGSLPSKAAKVRALNAAGVSTGDIGRYLDIRYQHVYNVLLRAGAIQKEASASGTVAYENSEIVTGKIKRDGSIQLPLDVLARFGLTAGSPIYCRVSDEGVVLLSPDAARRAVTEAIREKMPEQAALLEALFTQDRQTGGSHDPTG